MERLYLDALTGDEDAQLDFIRFIVTETDIPLPDVAVGWLTALAEPVNPCGQLGDAEAAMKYLKKLHKLAPDDAQCCLALARNYAMGCGSRLDYELALRYFQKAANLGDSYGTFMVDLHYYEGLGTRRNFKRAVDYFKRALEMGDTSALYHLGICCSRGEGVRQDSAAAEEYWQRGAALNDAPCCVALAMHCVDDGDLPRAEELLAQAREYMVEGDEELERQMEIVELCIATARSTPDAESV